VFAFFRTQVVVQLRQDAHPEQHEQQAQYGDKHKGSTPAQMIRQPK
jgi:hypothetical protein